jgi:GNAT superfamily N-acetyltransferase
MELPIKNSEIHLANRSDKSIVVKIIMESFKNDPHINWLLEKSRYKNKLEVIANYVVDETYDVGNIYLTKDKMGVALWHSEKKENFSLRYIRRNLSFLFKLGISTVIRNLKSLKISHDHFPFNKPFCYLYLIGVVPEGQGKGIASKLMNPVLDECRLNNIPVFLETANHRNVEIYKKKRFVLIDCYQTNSTTIHYMKIDSVN